MKFYHHAGKRLLDIGIAVAVMVLFSPPIFLLLLLVRTKLGKPVLFKQQRPGKNGRSFTLIKFRTMTDARNKNGDLLPDEERLLSFGRFLRSSSLDELPELWNVLKGEMSLVGPRPLLMRYLDRYTATQIRRHEVRPGITGWAQINGRNTLSWEEKFKLDVWYVDNQSFLLDLRILWLTIWKTIKREHINQAGHATMEEFFGTQNN